MVDDEKQSASRTVLRVLVSAMLELEDMKRLGIMEPRDFLIDLETSQGMWLSTSRGQLFDWAGYYGAKLIGHNHPGYGDANYLRRLLVAANNKTANPDFVTSFLVDYYRFLHKIAPKCIVNPELRVYTVNSGAEAVENALKYCINRFYHTRKPSPGTPQGGPIFMTFDGGFHGRTVFSLNMTDMPHNRIATRDYHGIVRGQIRAHFPAWDADESDEYNANRVDLALRRVREHFEDNQEQLAGVIVEPMQGAGGHRIASKEFFQGLSLLSYEFDVPLIFDEVQTAGGQTGTIWMCDQFDLPHPPECVVSAKKTGCGVVYMRKLIQDAGVLDSTWSGHLVDMVRVPHEFKIIEHEGLIGAVPEKTEKLVEGLRKLQGKHMDMMSNVRGAGLYQGFTMSSKEDRDLFVKRALEEENLLILSAGVDSVRFRPSLSVSEGDIDMLLEKLGNLLGT